MENQQIRLNHKQVMRYVHATAPDRLLVRMRVYCHSDDHFRCTLHHRDNGIWMESPMTLSVVTRNSRYYGVEIAAEVPRIDYFFWVAWIDGGIFLGENTSNLGTAHRDTLEPFHFEWDPDKVFLPPAWVKEAVFYQVFPERFCNGNPYNDPPGSLSWTTGVPAPDNFFGGDLQGIEQKIPYLAGLGVTAVWLNPVFLSPSNHKYNTSDYLTIDPHFGDKETFRRLVDSLHANDIRIILDGVFNHTGLQFWAFQDILEKGRNSRYRDWYYIYDFPVRVAPHPTYECWWDIEELPKLNAGNPEVRKYLLDAAAYWTREFNIDGWRLDVPNEIGHDFWVEFRNTLKSINPDCYIVGEIWDDGRPWLQGDQFDAVMNYLFRDIVLDFLARRKMEVSDFEHNMGILRLKYPQQVNLNLLNLLGSHDTARVLTVFKEEHPTLSGPAKSEAVKERMRLAVLIQMTYPGSPMVYYGDEIGMTGGPDPGCRKPMVWDEADQDLELKELYSRLIRIRRSSPALTGGSYIPLCAKDSSRKYCFARRLGSDLCIVALNLNSRPGDIHVPIGELRLRDGIRFFDCLGEESWVSKSGEILLPEVESNWGAILTAKETP